MPYLDFNLLPYLDFEFKLLLYLHLRWSPSGQWSTSSITHRWRWDPSHCCGTDSILVNPCNGSDGGNNKGIGDAGSTADIRMLWSAIVCLGLL